MVSKESLACGTGALVTAVLIFYSGYYYANRKLSSTINNN
jgi:hypothetical protein